MMLTSNEALLDELNPYSETDANSGRKSTENDFKMFKNDVETISEMMLTLFLWSF